MSQNTKAPLVRYDYKNKISNIQTQTAYMLAKTIPMFSYVGLPDTIPAHQLERIIQTYGFAFITEVDGALWAFGGTRGGEVDAYGEPRFITINNVFLNFNAILDIKKDGVLIKNDDMFLGMLPLYDKANSMIVENDTSMMLWQYNSRIQRLLSAPDDKTKESAQEYINKIIRGDLGVISENPAFEGLNMESPKSGGTPIQDHIELRQYLQGTLYNEVGISAQFNMKRERLISAEVEQTEDSLFPFVYSMMKNRVTGIEKLNAMYGLSVDVDFGSIWNIRNNEVLNEMYDEEDEYAPEEISDAPVTTDSDGDGDGEGGEGVGDGPEPLSDPDELILTDETQAEMEAKEEIESEVPGTIDTPEDAPEFLSGDTQSDEVEEELTGERVEEGSMESVDETGDTIELEESDAPETEAMELAEVEGEEPVTAEDEIQEGDEIEEDEREIVGAELTPDEEEEDEGDAENRVDDSGDEESSEDEVEEEPLEESEEEVTEEEDESVPDASEPEDEPRIDSDDSEEPEEGEDDVEAVESVEGDESEEPESGLSPEEEKEDD